MASLNYTVSDEETEAHWVEQLAQGHIANKCKIRLWTHGSNSFQRLRCSSPCYVRAAQPWCQQTDKSTPSQRLLPHSQIYSSLPISPHYSREAGQEGLTKWFPGTFCSLGLRITFPVDFQSPGINCEEKKQFQAKTEMIRLFPFCSWLEFEVSELSWI